MYIFYFEHSGYGWIQTRFTSGVDASGALWRMACNESVWAIPGTLDPTQD
jgi:hypothetical protein